MASFVVGDGNADFSDIWDWSIPKAASQEGNAVGEWNFDSYFVDWKPDDRVIVRPCIAGRQQIIECVNGRCHLQMASDSRFIEYMAPPNMNQEDYVDGSAYHEAG